MTQIRIKFGLRRHEFIDDRPLHSLMQGWIISHFVEDFPQFVLLLLRQVAAHNHRPGRRVVHHIDDAYLIRELRILLKRKLVDLTVHTGRIRQVICHCPNGFIMVIGIEAALEISLRRNVLLEQQIINGQSAGIA